MMVRFPPLTAYEPGAMGHRSRHSAFAAFQVAVGMEMLDGAYRDPAERELPSYLRVISDDDGSPAA